MKREKLTTKTNQVIRILNDGKIKHPAIIELINIIQEYDESMELYISELEMGNLQLSLERNEFRNIINNYNVRIQSLGFSLFQFLTFDIGKAYKSKAENNLKNFMGNHKTKIRTCLKS